MPVPFEVILENLRKASVQHGAAIKDARADIAAMAADFTKALERLAAQEASLKQVVADLQTLAAAMGAQGVGVGDDEAPGGYAGDDGEEEEDAEFEEAGG